MKNFTFSLLNAKAWLQRQQKTNPNATYVIEWRDGETDEVYNVSGKQWRGEGPSAGQILKYIKFLEDKAKFVKSKKTNSRQFYKFMTEQNDGGRDRGTGFAAKFPNGVEMDVVLDIYQYSHPKEAGLAAEMYKGLRGAAKCITRAKFLSPAEDANTATITRPQADFIVEPGLARNLKVMPAAA